MYCRFLRRYHPEMFVFENVPWLTSAGNGRYYNNVMHTLRAAGYHVKIKELNSQDFGVLQSRKRLIIIGWRTDTEHHYPEFDPIVHNYLVNDILQDLPSIPAGGASTHYRRGRYSQYLTDYGIRTRNDVLTFHTARLH